MSLGVILMSLMSFGGVFVVCVLSLQMGLLSLGVRLMSLGVGLDQELGHEFEGDFDEFDEFWVCVCCVFADFGGAFMSLEVHLMSLCVGLEQELGDEFGVDF